MAQLRDIEREYRVAYRHSPSHFYPGSFKVETESRRLVLVGVAKRHLRKRFRIVGILKPRVIRR